MQIDWKTGRKGFIQLVDEEDIPETHFRMNLHYLRTLPYEVASTEPAHIHEYIEPEPEPSLQPTDIVYKTGETFQRSNASAFTADIRTVTVKRDITVAVAQALLNRYSDTTIQPLRTAVYNSARKFNYLHQPDTGNYFGAFVKLPNKYGAWQ